MAPGSLDFNTALVTGGGGGIGKAMAEYFVSQGKKVIIAGRTEKNLQAAVKDLGNNSSYYVLDTGKTDSIANFVKKITSDHPDLDCLVNNAGVQRPLDVSQLSPEEFLQKADQEISININGPLHLAIALLPHFRQKPSAIIMNVSSTLGYLPTSIINPIYNGTKAWVHFFSMNLRTQLKDTNVKVIEIAPPQVSTDLHRERENPDDNKGPSAMSVGDFLEDVKEGWRKGEETIGAGPSKAIVGRWYETFGGDYEKAAEGWGKK
ncbi:hypothetical protein PRZ48_013971 [Zasmidium cellare]|uniref:Short-chain dehydrogenase n=1 Tax=Zasmidium cellare TaxID=395010 RepID=A0ABR0DZP1_ZASCE|nr:hypothetical protein PRZ48_013971 [Zasmidium cellare]